MAITHESEMEKPRRWRRLALGATAGGLAIAAAFALDDWANGVTRRPVGSGQLKAILAASRCWGDGVTLVGIVIGAIAMQPKRWKSLAGVLIVTLVCGGIVDRSKLISARKRPDETHPAPARDSWTVPENAGRNSSFPSGHSATAFAFARGLSLVYPPLAPVGVALASSTAASRMFEQRHYLSDCTVGGLFGWFAAGLLWNAARGAWRRMSPREETREVPKLRLVS